MYKGNMQDFIENLNSYLQENRFRYTIYLTRNNTNYREDTCPFILWFRAGDGSTGEYMSDTEDFEEIVYEKVRKYAER